MKYLLVFILCLLATSKMSIQGAFGKKFVINTADAICFNGLIFLFSAIVFSYAIIGCPWQVWVYAALGAVCSVLYQITYIKALAIGNVSLTVLIVNLGLVINVLFSYFFYGDSISPLRFVGILLTIGTFFLSVDFKGNTARKGGNWILFVTMATLFSALGTIVMKVLGESEFSAYSRAYSSASYIIAAAGTFLLYGIISAKGEKKTFKIGKKAILFAFAIGIILATYLMLNVYACSVVEGTFLFPTYAGGTIILSTLSGVILFKDKLNLRQVLSLILGIIAVVFINF